MSDVPDDPIINTINLLPTETNPANMLLGSRAIIDILHQPNCDFLVARFKGKAFGCLEPEFGLPEDIFCGPHMPQRCSKKANIVPFFSSSYSQEAETLATINVISGRAKVRSSAKAFFP